MFPYILKIFVSQLQITIQLLTSKVVSHVLCLFQLLKSWNTAPLPHLTRAYGWNLAVKLQCCASCDTYFKKINKVILSALYGHTDIYLYKNVRQEEHKNNLAALIYFALQTVLNFRIFSKTSLWNFIEILKTCFC